MKKPLFSMMAAFLLVAAVGCKSGKKSAPEALPAEKANTFSLKDYPRESQLPGVGSDTAVKGSGIQLLADLKVLNVEGLKHTHKLRETFPVNDSLVSAITDSSKFSASDLIKDYVPANQNIADILYQKGLGRYQAFENPDALNKAKSQTGKIISLVSDSAQSPFSVTGKPAFTTDSAGVRFNFKSGASFSVASAKKAANASGATKSSPQTPYTIKAGNSFFRRDSSGVKFDYDP
jgi:hypothetical protein